MKTLIRHRIMLAETIGLTFVVCVVLYIGVRACFGPAETLAFLLYDDAYYYFGVARNLAAGAGSTFDGINATNGYQPLWCWLLVPIFWLIPETEHPELAVRAAAVLWFLFAAAAPILIWKLLSPSLGAGALLAAALFGLHPFLGNGFARPNGLETPLYAVMILAFLLAFERALSPSEPLPDARRFAKLGLLLGAVVLARLDAGFLAMAAAAMITIRIGQLTSSTETAKRVGALVLGAGMVAGPSLLWNTVEFGHPVPVSGRMLSYNAREERAELGGFLAEPNLRRRAGYAVRGIPLLIAGSAVRETRWFNPIRRSENLGGMAILAGCLTLAALVLNRRRRYRSLLTDPLALMTLFAGLHFLVHAGWLWTYGEEFYRSYYFMPQALLLACLIASGAIELTRHFKPVAWVRYALGALVTVTVGLYAIDASATLRARYHAPPGAVHERHIYGWVRRELPPDSVLGARDAGKLGFFSGHPVINLDGLINDEVLLAAIEGDRVENYIASSPIEYLFFDRPWIGAFDPSQPAIPPVDEAALGWMLFRLHRIPGVSLRDILGPPPDWVVIEVQREIQRVDRSGMRRTRERD